MKDARRQSAGDAATGPVGAGCTPGRANGLPGETSAPAGAAIIGTPVGALARLIRERKFSSFEVVSAFVERIEAVNPRINAVVAFRPEEALKEAKQADEDLRLGNAKGPLHGIPCTIKDSFDTETIVSTAGTLGRSKFVPGKNATVVQRVRDAGAIIMGKSNTPEFTLSLVTNNLVYGRTRNPYDLTRSPGGSSGGAAAIVAAGGSPFDICTDTGGSIRFPAHCCGVAGIKPTAGRVPRTGHIIDYWGVSQSLTHVGVLAGNVEDLALLLNVIAGPDETDPYVYPVVLGDYRQVDFQKLRVAFFTDNGILKPSGDTFRTINAIVNIAASSGLRITQAKPAGIEEAITLYNGYLVIGDWVKRLMDSHGTTRASLPWVPHVPDPPSSEYSVLVEKVDHYRSSLLSFWAKHDVLICPVSPFPAPRQDLALHDEAAVFSYTAPFNITGWPSVVIRGGTSSEGLPIGVQIVAPPWREDICLSLAKFLESRLGPWKSTMALDQE